MDREKEMEGRRMEERLEEGVKREEQHSQHTSE